MSELKEPLISIIMPIYNGAKYLRDTIDSICNSHYRNIELLCIDDGSKDNSVEICREYKKKDNRIKVLIRMENGGVAQARNTGLEVCRGEYVCFADQDDIVSPNFYDILISDILNNNCQIAISNVLYLIDGIPQDHKTIKKSCVVEKEDQKHLLKWLVLDKSNSSIPTNTISKTVWNCMFNSELIRKNDIRFKRIVAYEDDWLFLLENIKYASRIFLEEKELYTWRIHKSQTTQNPKYIENYIGKRRSLRNFVFLQIKDIHCTDSEMQEYNTEYAIRLITEDLINEVNTRRRWDSTQLRSAKMNLSELWEELQQYLAKDMVKQTRSRIWKDYSFYNAIPKILVTYESYTLAIKTQILRNFVIDSVKRVIDRLESGT